MILVMILLNSIHWEIVYGVVHKFSLLYKISLVGVFIFYSINIMLLAKSKTEARNIIWCWKSYRIQTRCSKLTVKIAHKNSKICSYEKWLKQIMLGSNQICREWYTRILELKNFQQTQNMISQALYFFQN